MPCPLCPGLAGALCAWQAVPADTWNLAVLEQPKFQATAGSTGSARVTAATAGAG